MLNLASFAKEVHENAVAHGWWDEERGFDTLISLIHSEWSEALEASRNGEAMVWYKDDPNGGMQKPEGFAVEMIDGCIRILDMLEHMQFPMKDISVKRSVLGVRPTVDKMTETQLIAACHLMTANAYNEFSKANTASDIQGINLLINCMFNVMRWLKSHDLDYEKLILEKHTYNKLRPYKHGGKKF